MRHLTLALALLAAPAAAQDGSEGAEKRTVGGAQKFLSEVYNRGGHRIGFGISAGPAAGKLYRIQNSNQCLTVFVMTNAQEQYFIEGQGSKSLSPPEKEHALTVRWGDITKVVVEPNWRFDAKGSIRNTSAFDIVAVGTTGFRLTHPSEDEAKRLAFAMQFLKEECGLKTETGF